MSSTKLPLKVGIIGGSGLDNPNIFQNPVEKSVTTPYGPPSDTLLEGVISGVSCVLLPRHGRKHQINPSNVNYRANLWALKELGCTNILTSSACGSLKEEIPPGSVVIPDSFIDLTKKRMNTFYDGTPPFENMVYHLPMVPTFCGKMRQVILDAAKNVNIEVTPCGTAVVIEGPRFSTLAESKLYKSWGADLVNMTLSTESGLARELGLPYACIAMATDYDSWHPTSEKVNVANVLKTFEENVGRVTTIFLETIKCMGETDWEENNQFFKAMVESSKQSN